LQEPRASTTPDKHQNLQRRPFARCIENIQQVLANFNQKEIYIIEHLLGSMGESCYLQKR
jgi:hypothetical protein